MRFKPFRKYNLSNHLRRHHAINVEINASAPTAGSDLRSPNLFGQTSVPKNSHHAKAITASIARCFCKDIHPYSVVENTAFQEMINTLEPRYKIPSIGFSVKNVSCNCIGLQKRSSSSSFLSLPVLPSPLILGRPVRQSHM